TNATNAAAPSTPKTPTALSGAYALSLLDALPTWLVKVSGNITTLNVGPANTPTTGGVNDVSGQVLVGGALTTASVSGNVSGTIKETLTINSLYIGGSVTPNGGDKGVKGADAPSTQTPEEAN